MTVLDNPVSDNPVSVRTGRRYSLSDVEELDRGFAGSSPSDVVAWAVEEFGTRLTLTSSFADTLLVDIATAVDPDIEVVFLDTGFHFPETLATVRRAMVRYSLNLTVLRPSPTAADRWAHQIESCCGSRKVAPLERHLVARADAWLSGLRRDDSADRAATPVVELDLRGLVKINPLATWTAEQLQGYVIEHDVLVNPLAFEGYSSIGCWPCTEPTPDGDPRSGRWRDSAKTECGIH
jgi:phosphoadenosine phosphosulfate reductase